MAKEAEEQGQVSEELQNPVRFLTEALTVLVKQPGGLPLNIEGEERPYALMGCTITNVMVNSAWIGFTHDGCAFRTKEPEDREAFWNLVMGEPGATKALFTKWGILHRPVKPEPTVQKFPFIPRSQVHGHSARKDAYRSSRQT